MNDFNDFQKLLHQKLSDIDRLFENQRNLLILLHNNPDPDALASGFALKYIAEKRYHLKSTIAYRGLIGRAENRTMVKECKIPLRQLNRIRMCNFDRIALLDGQPGAGNVPLVSDVSCDIVIDHHPRRHNIKSDCALIYSEIGATATILIELIRICKLPIPADLATALAYAIRSETQDLGRETYPHDIKAFFSVYKKASMKKFARISHPKLSSEYFFTLNKALKNTKIYRNLIVAHLGEIYIPEIVAEVTDLLLRHQRIGWALCTGRYERKLILSIRSVHPKAKAGKIIKRLLMDNNNAGGHGMFAGGTIDLTTKDSSEIEKLEQQVTSRFANIMGYKFAEWKLLIDK